MPISCIGSPAHVSVSIVHWGFIRGFDAIGFDVAPGQTLRPFSTPVLAGPDVAPTTNPQVFVYRFWSRGFNNAHFFTTSDIEAENILSEDRNWLFEGSAFSAIAASGATCPEGSPVHRFYSQVFQSHFYTQDEAEKSAIIAGDHNWSYEGVAYCSYPTQTAGTVPLYRFWSPTFGKHFFTASQAESDHIRAVDSNWNYEGIAFYVLP